ncbi:hypothetical protein GCM10025870_15770 [Agromyces marinus]|uniref:Uncharacterized protein n=1 Tax=Agromyces marinus TaxID=1389020 RepID=A0ABM8H190_9MICO|nr:hypothetical protein GCM10025870_15770 [Agromyces marinus]
MGVDDLHSRGFEQLRDAAVDDEELLVLERAESVEDRDDARSVGLPEAVGEFGEQAGDEEFGESVGRGHVGLVDARLAVDAEADRHPTHGDGEQRGLGSREGTAGERDTEGAGALVRQPGDAGDLGQVVPGLGCGSGRLEDREVTGDAAPLVFLGGGALEMSSVTVTVSTGIPAARSCSCAASKFNTSPA